MKTMTKTILVAAAALIAGSACTLWGMAYLNEGMGNLMLLGIAGIVVALFVVMGALISLILKSVWAGGVFWAGLVMLTWKGTPDPTSEIAGAIWALAMFVVWCGGILALLIAGVRVIRRAIRNAPSRQALAIREDNYESQEMEFKGIYQGNMPVGLFDPAVPLDGNPANPASAFAHLDRLN